MSPFQSWFSNIMNFKSDSSPEAGQSAHDPVAPNEVQYPSESLKSESEDTIVHISYDPLNPPPHPGANWTRFICISDTHSSTFNIPHGDVLLHSGDLSKMGREDQIKITVEWLRAQPHPVKIIIAGNHDLPLHQEWYKSAYRMFHGTKKESCSRIRSLVDSKLNRKHGLVYLQDESHTFQAKEGGRTWSIYGSPWQPYYGGWAFNYMPGDEADALVSKIPEVDILLTHGPPHMLLDEALSGGHVGCSSLSTHLSRMAKPPRLHVFGHIHEGHGALMHSWSPSDSEPSAGRHPSRSTITVNAANYPMGPKARLPNNTSVPCGGLGFQPVIVDFLDVTEA
ncbi:hypothetical protein SERLA73DRAFT_181880 [Serpula lacrymans var. lacrymans S7.3]|uniref:Calcineurin-like phosphoesterase domain-containing protein n=2 Tax=Serpula lacrymans var. lacrymans TaxID=341189 RepID=F8PYW6_SERL3|nr:uncharacterized protein SERLADRAFT_468278 [Serpula lacrymans var. lacrymans S7.9]EGN99079.1 hypothetical protein SERLA73DRAFT_181880 [Serpula lacrymans var. lacrymans S7.3]EGO24653.1 hypothetical protein SERLADRAFT_468278 [Serpula lacrymans var. lacrymans S7.9]